MDNGELEKRGGNGGKVGGKAGEGGKGKEKCEERAHKMDGNVAILPSFYVRRHCHKLIGRCF